jgi:hypothetical protein
VDCGDGGLDSAINEDSSTDSSYGVDRSSDSASDGDDHEKLVRMPGGANDIGIGADGSVWIVGTNNLGWPGSQIYKWDGSTWVANDGAGVRIAVDPAGIPWIVNSIGEVWRYSSQDPENGYWTWIPGTLSDIGIGGNGDVWAIAINSWVVKWNGTDWDTCDAMGVRIAVEHDGRPWVVDSYGAIHRHSNNRTDSGTWELLPGTARDIGLGPASDSISRFAWSVGPTSSGLLNLSVWDEQTAAWLSTGGPPSLDNSYPSVAVDPDGQPWVLDGSGGIWTTSQ